ncbi:leucine-rich repeat-domain-containing protein [Scheffersomyces coipomensis]|uniref:leucine-rich repeat-domain-containing protein n=1 Tax=Scheffersomyces coipomensis TaxID=1788519 RepID=UPI00315DA708
MRLTSRIINNASTYLNPEGKLTLQLRNLQIPYIENLSLTQNRFSVIDLSNNELIELSNIPEDLTNLEVLLLANNKISYIDDTIAESNGLKSVVLTNNNISHFHKNFKCFKELENLSLIGNPIQDRDNYRLFIIWLIPSLKVLDFSKIKKSERDDAENLFGLQVDEPSELATTYLNDTSSVLNNKDNNSSYKEKNLKTVTKKLTDAEREDLIKKLQNASSIEEIEMLESTISKGYI